MPAEAVEVVGEDIDFDGGFAVGMEEAAGAGEEFGESWERVGDEEAHAGEAAVFEVKEEGFPTFEGFRAVEAAMAKDFLTTFESDAEGEEGVATEEGTFFVSNADGFGIDHDAEVIAWEGALHKVAGFGVEFFQERFDFVRGKG